MMTILQWQFLQRINKVEVLRSETQECVVSHLKALESSVSPILIPLLRKIITKKANHMRRKVVVVTIAAQSEEITMSRVNLKELLLLAMIKAVGIENIIANIRRGLLKTYLMKTLISNIYNILSISIQANTLEWWRKCNRTQCILKVLTINHRASIIHKTRSGSLANRVVMLIKLSTFRFTILDTIIKETINCPLDSNKMLQQWCVQQCTITMEWDISGHQSTIWLTLSLITFSSGTEQGKHS